MIGIRFGAAALLGRGGGSAATTRGGAFPARGARPAAVAGRTFYSKEDRFKDDRKKKSNSEGKGGRGKGGRRVGGKRGEGGGGGPFPPGKGRGGDGGGGEAAKVLRPAAQGITVAKKKGSSGGKYCFGCGCAIVGRTEQTEQGAVVDARGGGGAVSMGVRESKTGYWAERKHQVKISKISNWALCPRCRELQRAEKRLSGGNGPAATAWKQAADPRAFSPSDHRAAAASVPSHLRPTHAMTVVFQQQVSKLRAVENAVVVLCVDAVNARGSLINELRKYVGGHPILVAVTRCDLLPAYCRGRRRALEEAHRDFAAHLDPAGVYLCSDAVSRFCGWMCGPGEVVDNASLI